MICRNKSNGEASAASRCQGLEPDCGQSAAPGGTVGLVEDVGMLVYWLPLRIKLLLKLIAGVADDVAVRQAQPDLAKDLREFFRLVGRLELGEKLLQIGR